LGSRGGFRASGLGFIPPAAKGSSAAGCASDVVIANPWSGFRVEDLGYIV
jgi:hypothetical protein